MQKSSIKKISILGIILAGASVVTAAVLPKSTDDSKKFFTGALQGSTSGQTCVNGAGTACTFTGDSTTSEDDGALPANGSSTNGVAPISSVGVNTTA